ncbi:MAG: hypothetical protein IJC51_04620, partial [Eggerthellaceae bacterium]|nr:hypothetical protein [Eggerthellaceae bacterium]
MEGVSSVREISQGSWEWSTDADCALCHETQAESVASNACEISADAQHPCLPCHDDAAALRRAHELPFDRSVTDRLRETEASDSACGDCHDESDLASATS